LPLLPLLLLLLCGLRRLLRLLRPLALLWLLLLGLRSAVLLRWLAFSLLTLRILPVTLPVALCEHRDHRSDKHEDCGPAYFHEFHVN
jgi:hypothetical protein